MNLSLLLFNLGIVVKSLLNFEDSLFVFGVFYLKLLIEFDVFLACKEFDCFDSSITSDISGSV